MKQIDKVKAKLTQLTGRSHTSTGPAQAVPPTTPGPMPTPATSDVPDPSTTGGNPKSRDHSVQTRTTEALKPEPPQSPVPVQSVELEVLPASVPIVLPDKLEDFSTEIRRRVQSQCRQFLADTIAVGEAFTAATEKYECDLHELATKVGLDYTTVTQYVKVAECFGPSRMSWARAQLPGSVDSLMRLSRLKPEHLEDAVKQGKVRPDMGRKAVKALLLEYRPSTKKSLPRSGNKNAVKFPTRNCVDEVWEQLSALEEIIKKCKRQCPESQDDLLNAVEHFDAWFRDFLRMPQRAYKIDAVEKSPASES